MTFGSLFDGIGCFTLGLVRAGLLPSWLVEIDAGCRRVTAKHFPRVQQFSDVRECGGHNLGTVDLVCGGFPCQDLSVAGKRAGLAGKRSGLWSEFRRVLAEVRPRWVVVENVPGLLSSNGGRDMGALLWQLGELRYGWAYRCLDAQHFGLAQRRNRVFIVGCLGDAARAAAVLFEPESCGGNPPPRRQAGAGIAPSVTPGARRSSGNRAGEQMIAVARTQRASNGNQNGIQAHDNLVVGSQTAHHGRNAGEDPFVCQPYTVFSHNGCARECHAKETDTANAVDSQGGYAPGQGGTVVAHNVVGLAQEDCNHAYETDVSGCLQHKGLKPTGNEARTVVVTNDSAPVVAEDLVPTLRVGTGLEINSAPAVVQNMMVRRLTPLECLRLQGLPDDWLDLDPPLSDSRKYHMIGNGGATTVMRWIGERILEASHA